MKFRFVDQITELKPNQYITGVKTVSLEEYFLQRPLGVKDAYPATLMVESLFQLANFLMFKSFGKLAMVSMVKHIEIHDLLTSGQAMTMKVEIQSRIDDHVLLNGNGFLDEKKILSGKGCTGTLIDAAKLVNPEKFEMLLNRLYIRKSA